MIMSYYLAHLTYNRGILYGPDLIICALKSRKERQRGKEERFEAREGLNLLLLALKMERAMWKGIWAASWGKDSLPCSQNRTEDFESRWSIQEVLRQSPIHVV